MIIKYEVYIYAYLSFIQYWLFISKTLHQTEVYIFERLHD